MALWSMLCSKVEFELATSVTADDEDSRFSLVLEDATELFEDIAALLQSENTVGAFSNGLAVCMLFMDRFGNT